jgi:hypothetical protein
VEVEVGVVDSVGVGRVPLELMLMAALLMFRAALLWRSMLLLLTLIAPPLLLSPIPLVLMPVALVLSPAVLVLIPVALVLRPFKLELRPVRLVLRLVRLVLSLSLLELSEGREIAAPMGGSPPERGGKRSKRSDVALMDVMSADLRRRGPEMRRRRRLFHAASLLPSM